MYRVSFDPSSVAIGWCIYEDNKYLISGVLDLSSCRIITRAKKINKGQNQGRVLTNKFSVDLMMNELDNLFSKVEQFLAKDGKNTAFIERSASINRQAAALIAFISGAIHAQCYKNGYQVKPLDAMVWQRRMKKALNIDMTSAISDIKERRRLLKYFSIKSASKIVGKKIKSNDEADAINMCHYALV